MGSLPPRLNSTVDVGGDSPDDDDTPIEVILPIVLVALISGCLVIFCLFRRRHTQKSADLERKAISQGDTTTEVFSNPLFVNRTAKPTTEGAAGGSVAATRKVDPATGLPYEVAVDPKTGLPYEIPRDANPTYAQGYDGQLTEGADYARARDGYDGQLTEGAHYSEGYDGQLTEGADYTRARDPATGLPYEVAVDPTTGLPYEIPRDANPKYAQGYDGQLTEGADYTRARDGYDGQLTEGADYASAGTTAYEVPFDLEDTDDAKARRARVHRPSEKTLNNVMCVPFVLCAVCPLIPSLSGSPGMQQTSQHETMPCVCTLNALCVNAMLMPLRLAGFAVGRLSLYLSLSHTHTHTCTQQVRGLCGRGNGQPAYGRAPTLWPCYQCCCAESDICHTRQPPPARVW